MQISPDAIETGLTDFINLVCNLFIVTLFETIEISYCMEHCYRTPLKDKTNEKVNKQENWHMEAKIQGSMDVRMGQNGVFQVSLSLSLWCDGSVDKVSWINRLKLLVLFFVFLKFKNFWQLLIVISDLICRIKNWWVYFFVWNIYTERNSSLTILSDIWLCLTEHFSVKCVATIYVRLCNSALKVKNRMYFVIGNSCLQNVLYNFGANMYSI